MWGNASADKWHVVLPTVSVYASMDDMGKLIRTSHPEYDMSSWGLRNRRNREVAFRNNWEYVFTDEEIKRYHKGTYICPHIYSGRMRVFHRPSISYDDGILQNIMDEYRHIEVFINLGQIFITAYLYAKRNGCAVFAYLGK